jgi:alkylated DNA nucleotide flippase Atl1
MTGQIETFGPVAQLLKGSQQRFWGNAGHSKTVVTSLTARVGFARRQVQSKLDRSVKLPEQRVINATKKMSNPKGPGWSWIKANDPVEWKKLQQKIAQNKQAQAQGQQPPTTPPTTGGTNTGGNPGGTPPAGTGPTNP